MCIRDRNWAPTEMVISGRRDPAKKVPLVEPRSRSTMPRPSSQRACRCWRETVVSVSGKEQLGLDPKVTGSCAVSYTHLRAHETVLDIVCRLLLETKKITTKKKNKTPICTHVMSARVSYHSCDSLVALSNCSTAVCPPCDA